VTRILLDTANASTLNGRFSIAGELDFREGPGGLAVAAVENGQATAVIALQGAQLLSWAPAGAEPVIWLSGDAHFAPGKSIRGGVPICWPWFGLHATEPGFPNHGLARTALWEVLDSGTREDGATRLLLRFEPGAETRHLWPYRSVLECHVAVGSALEIELVTHHTGAASITIGRALHAYFQVLDSALARRIRVSKRRSTSTVVWNPWTIKAARLGDLGEDGDRRMVCVESANVADDVITIAPGDEHRLSARYQVEPSP
jgi:glucose-6-phosphate 1-epimerase